MKHSIKITVLLLCLFLAAQLIGLVIINKYVSSAQPLPFGLERPETTQTTFIIAIVSAILIGTGLALLLIKYRNFALMKLWVFLAVWLGLSFAFAAFINQIAAGILAFILALWRSFRPSTIVHNLIELFVYAGIAAILVPMTAMNIITAFILLVIISIYDIVAVLKTKHMIKLAKSQAKERIFSGLVLPYSEKKGKIIAESEKPGKGAVKIGNARAAVLGGGDIAFPLLFAGTIMKTVGIAKAAIIPVFAAAALLILLLKSEKGKFYPAMPFISIGCFIGYLLILLL